jgi:putative ABC transport system permease protein
MGVLGKDLRFAIRQCRHRRGFVWAIVSTLAVAVGANLAVFSVVDTVLVRALPFASPERLLWITSVRPDNPQAPFTLAEFMDYRSQVHALSGLAALANWNASVFLNGTTERLQGARMSANSFDVLGVSASAGRLLRESDDRADAPQVAILSYRLGQRLGGAVGIVGKSLRINGESIVAVGILPAQFPLPLRDVDVIVPLAPDRDPLRYNRHSVNFLRFFGRLSPGATQSQAQAELTSICRSLRQQFPVEYARKDSVHAVELREIFVGDYRFSMLLLFSAVWVVLATALANLLSLVLIRANERRPELSIRIAIGASRAQLARQLTIEALLLTSAGVGLGLVLAYWATVGAMNWLPPSIPRLGEVRMDRTVLLFATGLTIAITALFSIVSLGTIMRTRPGDVLTLSNKGSLGDRLSYRLRHGLVVGEISVALVLVITTTVLVQSLLRIQRMQPGFKPDGVFQARVSIPPTYRSTDDLARFYETLSGKLTGLPGVQDVGLISIAPLTGLLRTAPFTVEDEPPRTERESPSANLRIITPGYFPAVGTRLIYGRPISERDRSNTPAVALVSAALANRFFTKRVIGRRLLVFDNNQARRPVEVVGVVEDVRQAALDAPLSSDIYLPLRQLPPDAVASVRDCQFWMVRTNTDATAFRESFLSRLRAADLDAAASDTGTMRQYLEASLGPRRFNLGLFGVFSFTAVLLAVSGLYGLVSYSVSQRRREIGLRMALGATERDVQRLILRQAAGLGVAGAVVGLCITGLARPFAARFAQDAVIDPAMAAAATALLVTVVVAAACLPARRAARIQPMLALKGE